jgi:hypothetical protein
MVWWQMAWKNAAVMGSGRTRAGLLAPVERGRFLAGAAGAVALVLVLAR